MALRNCLREHMMVPGVEPTSIKSLQHEVDHATIVPDGKLPKGVVGLGTKVKVEYCDDGEQTVCRPVLPRDAEDEPGNVSVFTPLGLALLGGRVDQTVEWPLSNGRGTLQVRILDIVPDKVSTKPRAS